MAFCRRITIPQPGSEKEEVVYGSMKADIEAATKNYISDNSDSKGRQNSQSTDKETTDVIVSLKRRITSGELLVQDSDKSVSIKKRIISNQCSPT